MKLMSRNIKNILLSSQTKELISLIDNYVIQDCIDSGYKPEDACIKIELTKDLFNVSISKV